MRPVTDFQKICISLHCFCDLQQFNSFSPRHRFLSTFVMSRTPGMSSKKSSKALHVPLKDVPMREQSEPAASNSNSNTPEFEDDYSDSDIIVVTEPGFMANQSPSVPDPVLALRNEVVADFQAAKDASQIAHSLSTNTRKGWFNNYNIFKVANLTKDPHHHDWHQLTVEATALADHYRDEYLSAAIKLASDWATKLQQTGNEKRKRLCYMIPQPDRADFMEKLIEEANALVPVTLRPHTPQHRTPRSSPAMRTPKRPHERPYERSECPHKRHPFMKRRRSDHR